MPPQRPDFLTPADEVFVRTHLGEPRVDPAAWTLTVDGLVERPLRLGLPEMHALPARRLTAFHECFGSPFAPDVPTRAVANLEWTGVPLADLLERAVPLGSARHIRLEGADTGSFDGVDGLTYLKDLPLETAWRDVFLAYSMNGEPLPARHGFPLRAVVPRMFGTNSVKWLTRVVLTDTRPEHMFTTRFYNRVPAGGGAPQPVREVDVNSRLSAPGDGDRLPAGTAAITGWAWSTTDVVTVEVAVDDGAWEPAVLDVPGPGPTWQRFALDRPLAAGPHRIRSRATDRAGRVQPPPGSRNSVHEIAVHAGD